MNLKAKRFVDDEKNTEDSGAEQSCRKILGSEAGHGSGLLDRLVHSRIFAEGVQNIYKEIYSPREAHTTLPKTSMKEMKSKV